MVKWLTSAGLANDSTEAQHYAQHLLEGGLISSHSKRRDCTFVATKRDMYKFNKGKNAKDTC